jgi:hypothetical protein
MVNMKTRLQADDSGILFKSGQGQKTYLLRNAQASTISKGYSGTAEHTPGYRTQIKN